MKSHYTYNTGILSEKVLELYSSTQPSATLLRGRRRGSGGGGGRGEEGGEGIALPELSAIANSMMETGIYQGSLYV